MEKAFLMAEANGFLSGYDVKADPLYTMLKTKILSGEMTPSEADDAAIDYIVREHAKRSTG